jgi:hypothetical protein
MAYFKQGKPEKKAVTMAEAMKKTKPMDDGYGEIPGLTDQRGNRPAHDTAGAKASAEAKPKGMGLGKSLVNKTFKDGEDQYKITVTKVGKEK